MLGVLDAHQLSFFVILVVAFGLLLTERIRNDLVSVLIVVALALTGVLKPAEALAGFGSEPAIAVAGIFVLSSALYHTGVSETLGQWIGCLAGSSYTRALLVIMPAVAVFSAFTHHVTTTAVMLPVTLNLSRERGIPASKLLMPLSFAASLGTTITIIGAPAFLVASAILQQAGRPGLAIFSIAPIGVALSVAGTGFMVLVGQWLLPVREGGAEVGSRVRLDHYFTELRILPSAHLIGKTLAEAKANGAYHFTVVGWLRDGQHLHGPLGAYRIQADDVLLVHTTHEDLLSLRQDRGIELHPVEKFGAGAGLPNHAEESAEQLVQAVVAPGADLVGRSLREIDFRRRYGPIVVGLRRQAGFVAEELAQIRLRAGDVLVLQGDAAQVARVERDPAFLLLVPFHGEPRLRRKAPLAAAIMLATIGAIAVNLASLEIGTLAGAAAIVLTGCLTPRQAYRAIDARIYVFIAGAIPLGAAMQQTGAAKVLAGVLQRTVGGWPQTLILLVLFAVVGVITQLMSDAGTTALFAPVAVALAHGLGHAPEPYVVTVAMAAVAAFLTPIGHHGNLLVYGPGGYRFADFLRVGTPLTVLVGVVVTVLAPLLWRG